MSTPSDKLLCGLIGAGIQRSLTPAMQEEEARAQGLRLHYQLIDLDRAGQDVEALPTLLRQLKAGGYKVVQMKAKTTLQTLPEYDEAFARDMKFPTASARPVASVVQTVSSK